MQNEAGQSPAYERARKEITRLLSTVDRPGSVLQGIVEDLNTMLTHYSWVGIYVVEGDEAAALGVDDKRFLEETAAQLAGFYT